MRFRVGRLLAETFDLLIFCTSWSIIVCCWKLHVSMPRSHLRCPQDSDKTYIRRIKAIYTHVHVYIESIFWCFYDVMVVGWCGGGGMMMWWRCDGGAFLGKRWCDDGVPMMWWWCGKSVSIPPQSTQKVKKWSKIDSIYTCTCVYIAFILLI